MVGSKSSLSIVVPAFNEERRLPLSLARLDRYLARLDRSVEVIVVENGSTDQTAAVVAEQQRHLPYLRLLREPTAGKGWAVRTGMLAATGDYLMFCDADFSMPVEEIDRFLLVLEGGTPIVIASRELASSRRHNEPVRRYLMGRVFNRLVQGVVVPEITDTQCGFKAFQRGVGRELFARLRTRGWGFDVEILHAARQRGYAIEQLAIDWYYNDDSRVQGLPDSLSMLGDILRIRLSGLIDRPVRTPDLPVRRAEAASGLTTLDPTQTEAS